MSSFDAPSVRVAAVVLAATLALAGCGDPPRPFAHDGEVDAPLLKLADPAGIAVMEVAELPPAGQKRFEDALIDTLHRAEVPATIGGGNAQSYRLNGQAITRPADGGGEEVLIHWRMTDAKGQSRGNHVVRRVVDPKAWAAGDPELMRELARSSAAGVVSLLPDRSPQALAAATPQGRVSEPQPSSIVPPMGTRLAATPRQPDRSQVAQATPGTAVAARAADKAEKTGVSKDAPPVDLPPVALRPIAGAPGDGDESLRKAMTYFLGRNLINVVSEYDDPAAIVAGEVVVRPIGSKQQDVRVDWTVYAPDGRRLGTVGQSNRIPAGQLDGKWGDIAFAIAEGAVQGLNELFEQLDGFQPQKQQEQQKKK